MTTYSQNDEQPHILSGLAGYAGNNALLDIGAYDGRTFSNSLALIEMGWKGVLVEPSPEPLSAALKLHAARPNVHVMQAAVAGFEQSGRQIIELHATADAVSTTSEDFKHVWEKAVNYTRMYTPLVSMVALAAFTKEKVGLPGFINIDTEGTTYDVCRALTTYAADLVAAAKVICVEHVAFGQARRAEFCLLFPEFEVVYESGENLVLVRNAG